MQRPTTHDVAKSAQVSLATVDRVLNGRGGVAQKSAQRVQDAVEALGYVRDISAANLSRGRAYRFVFLLPDSASGFADLLREAVAIEQERLRSERVEMSVLSTAAFDVEGQVKALAALTIENADGVALMASETPEMQREIARLSAQGVKVVTLVADLPRSGRAAYVGPDNVVAGRTAASFMGRFAGHRAGDVLMVAGSLVARDHVERVMGFRAVMEEQFGGLTLLPPVQSFDNAETLAELVRTAQVNHDLVGVYAIGAGHRGLIEALGQTATKPTVIAHELTDVSRAGLQAGVIDLVIDQNPSGEVRAAVEIMRDLSDGRDVAPTTGTIPLNIFVRENI